MKKIIIASIIGILIVGGTLALTFSSNDSDSTPSENVVSVVDGRQIIEMKAKAGYHPRKVVAQAGIPTVLRMTTKSTFDCSSVIRIPSLNISKNLEQTGVAEFDLGSQPVGVLKGSCGMGMYPFQIEFR